MIFQLLRTLLFIAPPRVSREDALEIARSETERRGWIFNKPRVTERLRTWLIWANGDVIPSPFVIINQQTGDVVSSGYGPR